MASKEPYWGHKLCSMNRPGFTAFSPPSMKSEDGALTTGEGTDLCPLIDADKFIYVVDGSRSCITKLDDEGLYRWRWVTTKERGALAGGICIHDGAIYAYTKEGYCIALDMATGDERFAKQFAKGGCAVDQSSLAVEKGVLIVCGKDDPDEMDLAFNRILYALNAKNGNEMWKVPVKLGLMQVTPSIVDDLLVFQTISGEVACHAMKDGSLKWMSKPAGQVSTGGAVICKDTGLVYSTANGRGKKEHNKPRGGKGIMRAFNLKTGELAHQYEAEHELNALPLVAPVGPSKKFLTIFGVGANPGTWKEPTGDLWIARAVALDSKTGEVAWKSSDFVWGPGKLGPGGTDGGNHNKNIQSVVWSPPTASGNGRVYMGWHGCYAFEFDGATGEIIHALEFSWNFIAPIVVAPGLLVVPNARSLFLFRGRPIKGNVVRDLEIPLAESGYQHFWPHKQNKPDRTEYSELHATTDLSQKPDWVGAHIEKHPARVAGSDFYHKTPVIDSQRNIYVCTNSSRLIILRPDGTLRGTVHMGPFLSNPCLHDRYLWACNQAGYVMKMDIETLECVVNKKYCSWTGSDSWNPVVAEKQGILLVVGDYVSNASRQVGGNILTYGLRISDGSVAWGKVCAYCVYNFLPSVFEDEDRVIWSDNAGGLYCVKISDGTDIWTCLTVPENNGSFTTGHCCSGPNRMMYNAYNLTAPPEHPMGLWNGGSGAGGVIQCNSIDTGEVKWKQVFNNYECHVAPCVVAKSGGSDGYLVVAAQGCQGGYAPPNVDDPVLEDDDPSWPSGDAWEARIAAFDADTGDMVWKFDLPTWNHYEARGSYCGDIFLPDCFGSPTTNVDGNVYVVHWSGVAYCLEGLTGKVLGETDVGGSSQSAPVMVPGTLFLPQCYNVPAYRDEKLELQWLEEARANDDPRADPRLWVRRPQVLTDDDKDAFQMMFHKHPDCTKFSENKCEVIRPPRPLYSKKTWDARNARVIAKARGLPPPEEEKPAAKAVAKPEAKPAAKSAAKPAEGEGQLWVVVGGGKSGGITVRKGEGLKTDELGRLATGAKVKQIALKGERLHYKLVEGEGPDSGWVGLTFKGTDLLKRA